MAAKEKKQNSKEAVAKTTGLVVAGSRGAVITPRVSEKAGDLAAMNKYVFKVEGPMNKVELRKAIESKYGVKVDRMNMINVQGKARRYRNTIGRTVGFKKAIVTLTKDSKKLNLIEGASN